MEHNSVENEAVSLQVNAVYKLYCQYTRELGALLATRTLAVLLVSGAVQMRPCS